MYKIGEMILVVAAILFLAAGGIVIFHSLSISGSTVAKWASLSIILAGVGASIKKRYS